MEMGAARCENGRLLRSCFTVAPRGALHGRSLSWSARRGRRAPCVGTGRCDPFALAFTDEGRILLVGALMTQLLFDLRWWVAE